MIWHCYKTKMDGISDGVHCGTFQMIWFWGKSKLNKKQPIHIEFGSLFNPKLWC